MPVNLLNLFWEETQPKEKKPKKVPEVTHRIPYEVWENSQLSIVRHYGGCKYNGKNYELDFVNCRREGDKYFPDLVTYDK
jgi:hypothetical protein